MSLWQPNVQAAITRSAGVDQVEEIDYQEGGVFTRRRRVVGRMGPGVIVVLTEEMRRDLLDELKAELRNASIGTDTVGIKVFVLLLEDSLKTAPASARFNSARFGGATHDETRGIVYGQLSLGVDVVGTVRDSAHLLGFEQHLVMVPPGTYRPLSPADQSSLAKAIKDADLTDPLWLTILADTDA
jgi:hypothetical protein